MRNLKYLFIVMGVVCLLSIADALTSSADTGKDLALSEEGQELAAYVDLERGLEVKRVQRQAQAVLIAGVALEAYGFYPLVIHTVRRGINKSGVESRCRSPGFNSYRTCLNNTITGEPLTT